MSHDAWIFLGGLTTNVLGLVALWVRGGRTKATAERASSAATAAHQAAAVAAHEVQPNSGKSLADAVNRIEAKGELTARAVAVLQGQFKEHVLAGQQRRRRRILW
ncbi:hypothetical protein ACFT5B_14135 [Luteimicrobium sp. NPDC057192]|uniref:hypothetical protein n=1 Tax=Luteimicrobium sp. NPDC057192 TaxID=3346042 RepID=UPI00362BA479